MHAYEVRPRKDKRDVDLISEVLPFGRFGTATAPIRSALQSGGKRDRNTGAQGRFQRNVKCLRTRIECSEIGGLGSLITLSEGQARRSS